MQFYAEARRLGWLDGPRVAAAFADEFCARDLDMGSGGDDEADAYRGSAVDQPQLTVVLQIDTTPGPSFGHVRGFVPRGSNFGLAAAVTNYNRKPELTCAFARRMLCHFIEFYY